VPGTQRRRRHLISEVLRHVDGLHYVCHDERDRILAAYPHLSDSVDLVLGVALNTELPMLTDAESRPHSNGASAPATSAESKLPDSPLRVACIGNFARQKGADLLLALFDHYGVRRDLGEPLSVQFRVFGKLTPPYDQMARPSNNGIITFQGHYAPEQLPQLLKQCDVALFASIWPETFAIVLSEVWASGIVPVAPRLGAFAERIKDNVNGVLFDVLDNPGGVITVLDELAADRQRLRQLTANARDRSLTPIPTLDGNVRAYVQFWERVAANAGGSPELSAQRAAMLERASQTVLTPFWGTAARPAGNIHAHAGAGALQRRGNLAKRALVFYRRYGLSYTVRTAMRYPAIRRHIRDQAARP
jgi:glycosyltransferase involved in cell wall biosynthesis